MPWIDAVKQASKELKSEGKIGEAKSFRQTGSSNRVRDKRVKAKAPGKRIVSHGRGKKTVYYERRKNRSDKPGQLTGVPANMYAVRDNLEKQLTQTIEHLEKIKKSDVKHPEKKRLIKTYREYIAKLRGQLREQNQHIAKLLR